jgi:hypothetical protein
MKGRYQNMTAAKWNNARAINDLTNNTFLELHTLLRSIWLSMYHHQEQLVIGQMSSVYALQRIRSTWV